ncbi:NAD-dependent epimerase/dehydratase family protein [Azospirillum sp. RWY-5-1]|uniref:NAD-dependent epimerase/dehydratase family protein n=1 Tax=Azospirillum oleiclasticum TaxID=2735135 RepID=A0ABX2TLF8_9PROT|nr:NAD-dependent epimerase/dehydratase family protein [Azospirillum oleiclasticum]NYZ17768.1 NAD-dependent epimerase/dehydratase family protein [Azospirillum oleiclasticum]NYZ24186.1 NAD-dependent epimerase/dehydratase family protein [Azospirillum oleiclasticum]
MDRGLALVTGAGGFIGSHLVDRLVALGRPVRGLRRRAAAATADAVEMVAGDLRDAAAVGAAMAGVDTVYHLGGVASADAVMAAPFDAIAVNGLGTLNVLETARTAGVRRVVLMSSGHVFGRPRHLPVTEEHPLDPATPYAASKIAAEALAAGYHRGFGLPVVVLRPFNVYGPRQTAAAVIPTIVGQAVAGGPVRVRNTAPRRDYLYVSDIVDALLLAAGADGRAVGRAFVLASGRAVSVAGLMRRVLALTGNPMTPPEEPADGEDSILGDAALARDLLGWMPRVALEDGLARTVDWWRTERPAGAVPA